MTGERVRTVEWVHGTRCVVQVVVDAIRPADDPSELYLDAATVRHLDHLQELADAGQTDELAKFGTVFVPQSA